MLSISEKSKTIEILMVVESLKKTNELDLVGGPYYIAKLTNSVTSTAIITDWCSIVYEKYLLRQQISMAGKILKEAYEPSANPFEILDSTESSVSQLMLKGVSKTYKRIGELANKRLDQIEKNRIEREKAEADGIDYIAGIDTGFPTFNKITNGWQPSDLIILAARPAVGKTALALNLGGKTAKKGIPVAVFSLEMSDMQLTDRVISNESEIFMGDIKSARISDDDSLKLSFTADELENMPLFIDDTAGMTIIELRSKIRHLVINENVGLVIIDYLQLLSGTGKDNNREREISNISRNLKIIAKELNIPIIALSQLNRSVELRKESKIPILGDLRESGAIEQDADVVIFAWRLDAGLTPEEILQEEEATGQEIKGKVGIKFAKHRNGELDTIMLRANLGIQKFYDPLSDFNETPLGNWKPLPPIQQNYKQDEIPF